MDGLSRRDFRDQPCGGDVAEIAMEQARVPEADQNQCRAGSRTGLPVGLQIVGKHWDETTVLALAHAYEQAASWHTKKPTI